MILPPLQALLSCRDTDSSCLHVDFPLVLAYSFEPRSEIICVVARKEESIPKRKKKSIAYKAAALHGWHEDTCTNPASSQLQAQLLGRGSGWRAAARAVPGLGVGLELPSLNCPGSFPKGVISLLLLR